VIGLVYLKVCEGNLCFEVYKKENSIEVPTLIRVENVENLVPSDDVVAIGLARIAFDKSKHVRDLAMLLLTRLEEFIRGGRGG